MRTPLFGILFLALAVTLFACSDSQTPLTSPQQDAGTVAPQSTMSTLLISCPSQGAGGDQLYRGFYIPSYPGYTLSQVNLYLSARAAGNYTILLTARDGAFDGTVIGTASVSLDLTAVDTDFHMASFMFAGDPAVTMGNTVVFTADKTAGPDAEVFFEVSACGLGDMSCVTACPVIETETQVPPLGSFRRNGITIDVYGMGTMMVDVDIKPGSMTNPVNLGSQGLIPVAILGSDVFDVTMIDESTLAFGPGGAMIAHRHAHLGDVNEDGIMDLMAHFRTQETGIMMSDTEACLEGYLMGGTPIMGCDVITIVPREVAAPDVRPEIQ